MSNSAGFGRNRSNVWRYPGASSFARFGEEGKDGDYEVGYGKPPRHTRFKIGQSGNPRGRRRGSKNVMTVLDETLNEPVIVAENGGRRKIRKLRAIIKQLVNQSAKADWRAAKMLLDFIRGNERSNEPASAETSAFSEADEKVLEQLRARNSEQ